MKLKLAKKARLKWDERERKFILLYPERGLLLNETAAEIVKMCDGTKTADEIVEAFALRGDSASAEVSEFLEQLRVRNLFE